MDKQRDSPKRPAGERFRAIIPACLPGNIHSYGAKLRQKTKLGLTVSDTSYSDWRRHAEERFSKMRPVSAPTEIHDSPSGKYSLEIIEYTSGLESWNYSRGIVRQAKSQQVIADIRRNLAGFWFAWVQRPDGEYLLCGEDYQGYNVIDLGREINTLTFPAEAYKGMGFCWGSAYPSPTGQLLAVEGRYWGGPNEVVIYDFSNPLRSPLPELARAEETLQAKGWLNDAEFEFTAEAGDAIHTATLRAVAREA